MKTLRRPFTRSLSVLLLLCLLFTLPAVALAGSDNQNAPILSGTSQVQPPTNAEVLAEFVLSQDLSKVFTDKEIKAILADDGNFGLHAEVFSTDEEEDIFDAKDFSTTPVVGVHEEYTASENVKAAAQKRVCSGEGVVLEWQGRAKDQNNKPNINIADFSGITKADILKAAEIVGREISQNPLDRYDANADMAEKLRALVEAGYQSPNKSGVSFEQQVPSANQVGANVSLSNGSQSKITLYMENLDALARNLQEQLKKHPSRSEELQQTLNKLQEQLKDLLINPPMTSPWLTKAVLGLAIKNAQLDAGLRQAAADGVVEVRIQETTGSSQIEEEEIEDVPQ